MSNKAKVAIVTGAARGIGLGIANRLADDGFALSILDVGERSEGVELLSQKTEVLYVQGDLSRADDRARLVRETVERFGRIDVLVNNAGVAPRVRCDMLETGEESFDWVLGINLKGNFFLTQAVANQMISEDGGFKAIINIASMSSYTSSVNRPEYCISKAGVSMCTTLFADRLSGHGIGVYEVRPGIIATDMTSGVKGKYDALIDGGLLPIKRWGKPEDIADAVAMLAGGALKYSTGEVINVDGGFHLRRL